MMQPWTGSAWSEDKGEESEKGRLKANGYIISTSEAFCQVIHVSTKAHSLLTTRISFSMRLPR